MARLVSALRVQEVGALLRPLAKQNGDGPGMYDMRVIAGLPFVLETAAGEKRRPQWPALKSDYGYLLLAEGKDGDQIDAFIRPGTEDSWAGPIWVVDQYVNGKFDEHKVLIGWDTEADARAGYLENYARGWGGLGSITQFTPEEFKRWAESEGARVHPVQKGDFEGHPFRGNQWTEGLGGGVPEDRSVSALNSKGATDIINHAVGVEYGNSAAFGGCLMAAQALKEIYPEGKLKAIITTSERHIEAAREEGHEPLVQHFVLQIGDDKYIDALGIHSERELLGDRKYPWGGQMKDGGYLHQIVDATPSIVSDASQYILTSPAAVETLASYIRAYERQKTEKFAVKGDFDGHPFRGNQYTLGDGSGEQRGFSSKLTGKEMIARAVKHFGITHDPREGGYILPDGRMLDFSGKREGGSPGERSYDHRQVGSAFEDTDFEGGTEGMHEFASTTGSIRMHYSQSDGSLNIQFYTMPTREQISMMGRMRGVKTINWDAENLTDYRRGDEGVMSPDNVDTIERELRHVYKDAVITKGDYEGHPFRGNQWTAGVASEAGPTPSIKDQQEAVDGIKGMLSAVKELHDKTGRGGKMPPGWVTTPNSLLLEHGRAFLIDENTFKGPRGAKQQCFRNAGLLALDNPELTYVEGQMTVHGVPIDHAWVVDKQGHVIDPTVKGAKGSAGYFGVPISTDYLRRTIVRSEYWGLLDPVHNEQIYKDKPSDFVVDIKSKVIKGEVVLLRASDCGCIEKFDPDQPRIPAGNPDGGQWTSGGGGVGSELSEDQIASLKDEVGRYNVGGNVELAVKLLGEGKQVVLNQPREVSTLLNKLYEVSKQAVANGQQAKTYNLCNVSVAGTNLFCAESKGYPRVQMPQLGGFPKEGSPAFGLPRTVEGGVELGPQFAAELIYSGHEVLADFEDAAYLRPSQMELDGSKVAAIVHAREQGKLPPLTRLFISKDNYIIDGHHRWAAEVAVRYTSGKPVEMPVYRVDMGITELLNDARDFAERWGIPQSKHGAFKAAWGEFAKAFTSSGSATSGITGYSIEGVRAKLRARRKDRRGRIKMRANGAKNLVVFKGDFEGHPFRGNQYTEGTGGSEKPAETITVYHGTADAYIDSIKKEGLVLHPPRRNFDEGYYTGERGESVFVAMNKPDAAYFARAASRRVGAPGGVRPVVIEVALPKDVADKMKRDTFLSDTFKVVPVAIKPEWIKSIEVAKADNTVTMYLVVFVSDAEAKKYSEDQLRDERGRWTEGGYTGEVPKGGFKATVPGLPFSFESQSSQYPRKGPKGISYFKGVMGGGKHVDALLYRDDKGKVIGILNHYPFDFPPYERKGNITVLVDPAHQRKGIGSALMREAGKRWNVNLKQQNYTQSGAALANAMARKARKVDLGILLKYRPDQLREHGRFADEGKGKEAGAGKPQGWSDLHEDASKRVIAYGNTHGREMGVVFDPKGGREPIDLEGSEHTIVIPNELHGKLEGMDLVHNHPNATSLSNGDLGAAVQNKLNSVTAVDADGGIFTAKVAPNADAFKLFHEKRVAALAAVEMLRMKKSAGIDMTDEEATLLVSHASSVALLNAGKLSLYEARPGTKMKATLEKYPDIFREAVKAGELRLKNVTDTDVLNEMLSRMFREKADTGGELRP